MIDDDCINVSNHRPVVMFMLIPMVTKQAQTPLFRHVKWNKADRFTLSKFRENLDDLLITSKFDGKGITSCSKKKHEKYHF